MHCWLYGPIQLLSELYYVLYNIALQSAEAISSGPGDAKKPILLSDFCLFWFIWDYIIFSSGWVEQKSTDKDS